jgi:hypothetical protein
MFLWILKGTGHHMEEMLCDKKTTRISVSSAGLLIIGATVFGTGILLQEPAATYSGIGAMSTAFAMITYLVCTVRRNAPIPEFPAPPQPLYVYTIPGMKRNKSDTSLELMTSAGSPKTDDSGRVLTLNLV